MLAVAFLYLCFTGTMFLGSLILGQNHYPLLIASVRFGGSGIMLLTWYAVNHPNLIWQQLRQLYSFIFFKYAVCLYTISAIGFSWGMQYVDPVKACFIFVLTPFATAILLYCLKNEKLTQQKIYGLIIGVLAVIPIVLQSAHKVARAIPWHLESLGYLAFSCAVVTFSYGWILNQEMQKTVHVPSSLLTGAALSVGGGLTFFLTVIVEGKKLASMQLSENFWWLLLMFAILTAVAYNLYTKLLKRYSATFVAFASFLEPAFGLLYAAVFLGQPISTISFASLLALGAGLYLFYQEELRLR